MAEKANILLVDDRDDNLTALEAILSSLDQNLVRATSGEDALKALLEDEFAVILLDVVMPGMDGFETAAHIKQRDKTKDVPIIFLTAAGTDRHQVFRGYAARAVDYLAKPFDPWVLRAKVSVFVELHEKNRRLAEQAKLLQKQLQGDQPGDAPVRQVVEELSGGLTAVTGDLAALRDRVATDGTDPALVTAVRDVEHSVARLSSLLEALRGAE
ncbi:response regulator [Allonocardiopsis opalescens]|uniref:Response regulator receiver domain-containing protein n=1 Tax=Allonocardiopsis opalescens TaxID=1144618 RepID=A0A2T0Q9M5_9ACTN|nr:response regulator [Allonocardiopsis opalescens]PRY00564.1 response regulator receiver domain-containing protein [Allonocardiopsis opalescens]